MPDFGFEEIDPFDSGTIYQDGSRADVGPATKIIGDAKGLVYILFTITLIVILGGYFIEANFENHVYLQIYIVTMAALMVIGLLLVVLFGFSSIFNRMVGGVLQMQTNANNARRGDNQVTAMSLAMMAKMVDAMKPQVRASAADYQGQARLEQRIQQHEVDLRFLGNKQAMSQNHKRAMQQVSEVDDFFGDEEYDYEEEGEEHEEEYEEVGPYVPPPKAKRQSRPAYDPAGGQVMR